MSKKVIDKVPYPNAKIYVGQDVTESLNYFGSVDGKRLLADFTPEMRSDFTVRKPILWESKTATKAEINKMEREFIEKPRSNDPAIGCNKWPKFKPQTVGCNGLPRAIPGRVSEYNRDFLNDRVSRIHSVCRAGPKNRNQSDRGTGRAT